MMKRSPTYIKLVWISKALKPAGWATAKTPCRPPSVLSGFDVLDILRNTPETNNIHVVMLTALSQPKDKERAESLGVDDYLVKSQVVIGDVIERVRYHLGMVETPSNS
jgi:CheY-like chemotaxis protein